MGEQNQAPDTTQGTWQVVNSPRASAAVAVASATTKWWAEGIPRKES